MKLFLKGHKAWLFFFFGLLCITNVIYLLDAGISSVSMLYLNSVQLVLFIIFLVIRFMRERPKLHYLQREASMEDLPQDGLSATEKRITERFMDDLHRLAHEKQLLQVDVQEEQDDILAWVHEMKAPLTALKLMHEQVENPRLQQKIQSEWLRLYLLVDQRLHQTRLATIAQDNRLERVGIRQVVYQEIRELRSWCMEKGIGVEVDELEKQVVTDVKWLAFIVRQVLSNAVKYSEPQSTIDIGMQEVADHLVLIIRDEGCGIRPEDLPRIFRKSYTGTVGRESTASTGMGLYLAKRAADQLGITLNVKSELNKGTTVFIQFPLENEYTKSFGM